MGTRESTQTPTDLHQIKPAESTFLMTNPISVDFLIPDITPESDEGNQLLN